MDRDPVVTIWTALDPATIANGCVQVIPGSHRLGLLSEEGHTITPEQEAQHCPEEKIVYLELEPGEAVLLHNWLLHRSDVNKTDRPRRGFSVCYMDARTRTTSGEPAGTVVFGKGALSLAGV
jgi:ectoine hydroxylase-related dioxygenase (phytanoyl-CoA dioxygenase family)